MAALARVESYDFTIVLVLTTYRGDLALCTVSGQWATRHGDLALCTASHQWTTHYGHLALRTASHQGTTHHGHLALRTASHWMQPETPQLRFRVTVLTL